MKIGISRKTQFLLLTIASVIALVGTLIFFFVSEETDQFKIFMRGFSFFTFLFYSILYGRQYLRESRKSD